MKTPYVEWLQYVNPDLIDNGLPLDDAKPILAGSYLGLQRYIDAQEKVYQTALNEVKSGRKVGHWIWFIFPQLNHSNSELSKFYALGDRYNAEQYINDPTLGNRLIEITKAVYNNNKTVYEIFGNDVMKFRNCMMLFASISDNPIFKKVINKFSWK